MKRLAVLFLCLSVTFVYAQKSNVQSAYNYLRYDQLDKAKEAIDAAIVYESTAGSEKAWYFRGLIYEKIYEKKIAKENFGDLHADPLKVAYESYKKALEIAPKGDYTTELNTQLENVGKYYAGAGIKFYSEKNYSEALKAFEMALTVFPNDTNLMFNAGLSADRSGDMGKAVTYYTKVLVIKPQEQKVYSQLVNALFTKGDTAQAIEVIRNGRKIFPDDLGLLLAEINVHLAQGKRQEVIALIKEAINKDPNNATLYFALGNTYDNLSGAKNGTAATTETSEYSVLAEAAYKKAIELKPDYFEANYNLGALYYNQGAQIANKANQLPSTAQKEFEAARKQYLAKFTQAQPYFEKALQLNPNDGATLINLRELYAKTNQLEKSTEMKKRYEALGK